MDYIALANECGAQVHPVTMAALMHVESSQNPYAIGVVNGKLLRQPRNKPEAIATANALEQSGWNFSLGKSQVNRYNLVKYGLTYETAFEPCPNMRAGAAILKECYDRALPQFGDPQRALQAALSCYYSGNFKRGFVAEGKGKPSYVGKVLAAATLPAKAVPAGLAIPVVPTKPTPPPGPPKAQAPAAAAAPIPGLAALPLLDGAAPVVLRTAMPARKAEQQAGVPAKYDGYQMEEDEKPDRHDGYAANGAE